MLANYFALKLYKKHRRRCQKTAPSPRPWADKWYYWQMRPIFRGGRHWLFIFLLGVSFSQATQAVTHEKRPGAMNPSIDPGDRYDFKCHPSNSPWNVNQSGQVTAGPKAKPIRVLELGDNRYSIRYLECFIRGQEIFTVYEQANGSAASVIASRCPLSAAPCKWKVEIDVPNVGVPTLQQSSLQLPLGILDIHFNIETGRMSKWRGTGCLQISRTDASGTRSRESVGPHCS
jgi:hypothetical protein